MFNLRYKQLIIRFIQSFATFSFIITVWPSAKRNRRTPRAVHYKAIKSLCAGVNARSGQFFFLQFSAKVNWKPGHVSTISHERTFQKQKEKFIKREKVYSKLRLIGIKSYRSRYRSCCRTGQWKLMVIITKRLLTFHS